MQIVTRAAAAAAGATQYFTGKPCKNGHVTYRYVQSGTCSTCIADATRRGRLAIAGGEAGAAYSVRRELVVQLVELKVRAYEGDAAMLRQMAAGLCVAKYPTLTPDDVTIKAAPTDYAGRTALYRVRAPLEHAAMIQATANALLNAHAVDLSGFHAAQVDRAAGLVASPPAAPDWRFQ